MLAERIKELIKIKGYSQVEFANLLGITRSTLLSLIDRPSFSSMEKIAKALDVPMWRLFISPEEIPEAKGELSALVVYNNTPYEAHSLQHLKAIVYDIEYDITHQNKRNC